MDRSLPFERGTTFRGNTANTAAPSVSFAGRWFDTNDADRGADGHGTTQDIRLVALQNLAGANITGGGIGARPSTLNTVSAFQSVNGTAASGARGYLLDDAYTSGFAIGHADIFYGVKQGLTKARASVTAGNWSVGSQLAFTTGGLLRVATQNNWIVAVAGEAATTAVVRKNVFAVEPFIK